MTKTAILRSALSLAAALAIAGCSDEQTAGSAGTGAQADACSMLTAQAISSQIGKVVGEGRKTNEVGGGKSQSHMTTCLWETQASAQGVSAAELMRNQVSVTLLLWSWPNAGRAADYLESFREVAKEMGEPEPTPVSLGDEAIRDGSSVHVRQGNASFTVTVQTFGDADQQAAGAAAEALAGQVAAKL